MSFKVSATDIYFVQSTGIVDKVRLEFSIDYLSYSSIIMKNHKRQKLFCIHPSIKIELTIIILNREGNYKIKYNSK